MSSSTPISKIRRSGASASPTNCFDRNAKGTNHGLSIRAHTILPHHRCRMRRSPTVASRGSRGRHHRPRSGPRRCNRSGICSHGATWHNVGARTTEHRTDPWPEMFDNYSLTTWVEGINRLFSERDFEIQVNGTTAGYVRTVWAPSTSTRARPLRSRQSPQGSAAWPPRQALPHRPRPEGSLCPPAVM